MKPWQNILVNVFAVLLSVLIGVRLFSPSIPPPDIGDIQHALNSQMKDIQTALTGIQEAIQKQQAIIQSTTTSPTTNIDGLPEINQKLDMIIGKMRLLQGQLNDFKPGPARPKFPPLTSSGGSPMPNIGRQNPMAWIEALPDQKRQEVNQIFEDHARRIRERLPASAEGGLPDLDTMRKLRKESEWELKEDLKAILTDEEYQGFLDSHPKPQARDLPLPSMPGQRQ